MPKIKQKPIVSCGRCVRPIFIFLLVLTFSFSAWGQIDARREQIIASLRTDQGPRTLKATVKIGIPHPTAPLVQWTDGLLAYQKESSFLYLKAYQPLIPVYFLLKSSQGKFELYFPRGYTVYSGTNDLLAKDVDTDLKLNAGDILKAIGPLTIKGGEEVSWEESPGGEKVVIRDELGKVVRTLTLDPRNKIARVTFYNEAGFAFLDVFRSNFKWTKGFEFPFELKLKRLVPAPSELILNFKEIRPAEPLNPAIFTNQFPAGAKRVELTR